MNPSRLQQILAELNQQKEVLRNQYQQTLGAVAIVEKLLTEFPKTKEAEQA